MATPAPAGVEFTGRREALFKIIFKNALLNIVTIGIYRFWGKTRVRRFFWSNIVIGGEPLEYTGRGLELFIGFLIVLAVLIPLSLIQQGLAFLVGTESDAVDALSFVVFLVLLQFALFRMWRYRLTRTRWRGIRFRLEGSALRYAGRAFLWLLAQAVTLGIATPWARVDLMRYKLRRVNYGDTAFGFEGRGRDLLVPWLIAWVPPALLVVVALTLLFGGDFAIFGGVSEGQASPPTVSVGFLLLPLAALLFIPLFIWYRVREFRYFIGSLGFANARFESSARMQNVILPMLFAAAIFLFVFGFLATVAQVVLVALVKSGEMPSFEILAMLIPFALFVLVLLFAPLVTYPVVVFTIVSHLWTTLSISNPEAFNRAVQATEEGPKFGEGLADAFDVGAL